jgi:gliding motility-associated-like protein
MAGSSSTNQAANFGTLQVAAATNQPPGKFEFATSWIDNSGNLWMFSGARFSATSSSDDMWKYDVATNMWIWMSGQQTGSIAPNHGTIGVAAATNTPGTRLAYAHWKDASGNFWMYGGRSSPLTTINIMSDMWMYNPVTNLWTWMAGSTAVNANATFTQKCTPGSGNPAGLWDNYCCWTDDCGRFWVHGGQNNTGTSDMTWAFDPVSLQFSWVTGSTGVNLIGNFGTQNTPATTNSPPSLRGHQSFRAANGDLWLFGGSNANWTQFYNTVWRYQIDPNCPGISITAGLTVLPISGCAPFTPQFTSTTTNASTYHWNFGDPSTQADTGSSLNTSWTYTQSGTYTVTLIVSGNSSCSAGVSDTKTTTITVINTPVVDLGSDTVFCSPTTNFPLNAGNPGMNYSWSTGATTQTIAISNPGTYFVTASAGSSSSCADRDTIVIGLAAQPNIGNDTNFCAGQSTTLATTLPGTYLWNTGDTTAALLVSTSGTYVLEVTTQNCVNTDSITITVNTVPAVDIGADTILCNPTATLLLDAANSGMNYSWSTGATAQSITTTTAGIYSVTVTNPVNAACADHDSIAITYVAQPNLGSDTTICSGQSVLLNPGITGSAYLWNTGDTTATIAVNTTGLYSVQVTNSSCTSSSAVNITVNPTPVVNLGNDKLLCPAVNLVLDAQNSGAAFSWSTGATTQSITVDTTGLYAVVVTLNNCSAYDSMLVNYSDPVRLGDELSICGTLNGIELDAGNPGADFLWNTGATTQTIQVEQAGVYSVVVDNGSCTLIDSVLVTGELGQSMLFIPNSFTPDENGSNEKFLAVGNDIGTFSMLIYDRWGNKVFESADVNIGWDGKYKGEFASGGVFVYVVEYTPDCSKGRKQSKVGHITVIR